MADVRSLTSTTIALAAVVSAGLFPAFLRSEFAYATSIGRCQETQLDVRWSPDSAGLGHVAGLIVLTNISANTCTLSGYPTVRMTGPSAAHVLVAKDTQNGYLGGLGGTGSRLSLPVVTLRAHGGTASAMVEGIEHNADGAKSCWLTSASVTLPHLSPAYRLTIRFPGCVRPQVHPIVKGPSGSSVK